MTKLTEDKKIALQFLTEMAGLLEKYHAAIIVEKKPNKVKAQFVLSFDIINSSVDLDADGDDDDDDDDGEHVVSKMFRYDNLIDDCGTDICVFGRDIFDKIASIKQSN